MYQPGTLGKRSLLLAAIVLCALLVANLQVAQAAESGCITCHTDKEMLQNNLAPQKGKKSAMQSGAG
jgi:hypothetical protein